MSDDAVFEQEWDEFVTLQFLEAVSLGTPPDSAAYEVGWTPRHLKKRMREDEFAEMVRAAQTRRDDRIERKLYDVAAGGNVQAMQIILFNRRGSEFRDVKKIEITTTGSVKVEHVLSVKEAARALMAEDGVAALQPGGPLDNVIDADSTEDSDG